MVKNLFAIIAFLSISIAITAQTAPAATTPNSAPVEKMGKMGKMYRMGKGGGEKIKEKLGLTDDQATKFKAIADTYRGKMKAIKTDAASATDKKATKQKVQELRASEQAEIKALLTPDQYTKYQAMIEARKEKAHNRYEKRKVEKAGEAAPDKQ